MFLKLYFYLLGFILLFQVESNKILNLHIYYPIDNLVSVSSTSAVFDILISSITVQNWGYRNETYYVYNNTDYAQDSHWIKNISIPSDYVGNLYFELTGHMSDDFSRHYSVSLCDSINIVNPYCQQQGMPYVVNITKEDNSLYSMSIYPSFGNIQGETYTLFESLYSPQLNNTRKITIYKPNSIKQNIIKRDINILLLNDGDLDTLDSYVYSGGLDVAIQTGLIPESIMIGIPFIEDSNGCQRTYELTYGPCNTTLMGTEGQSGCTLPSTCYGGNNKYFDFIEQTIIPNVLNTINMSSSILGAVTMVGFSLGGLTSCNAVLARPNYYKRALCMSPSMWYNKGEFSSLVTKTSTILPVSVVMTLGTQENVLISGDYWSNYVDQTRKAWYMLGLGKEDIDISISKTSNLAFFQLNGGTHSTFAGNNVFYEALKILYSTEYTYTYNYSSGVTRRLSLTHNYGYIFPNNTCINSNVVISNDDDQSNKDHNHNDDDDDNDVLSTTVIILIILLCLSVLINIFLVILQKRTILSMCNQPIITKTAVVSGSGVHNTSQNPIIINENNHIDL